MVDDKPNEQTHIISHNKSNNISHNKSNKLSHNKSNIIPDVISDSISNWSAYFFTDSNSNDISYVFGK